MSMERLELLSAAHQRQRAAFLLELGQILRPAFAGGAEWSKKQREMIKRIRGPS